MIKKERGSSIDLDIHHSKVPSSDKAIEGAVEHQALHEESLEITLSVTF